MRLLAWNILHGGGTRVPRIVEEIAAYDPDIIALTGFRADRGMELGPALQERGWPAR
jgi:exodeoxyribonuclease-3